MKKNTEASASPGAEQTSVPFMIRFLRNCGHLYSFLYVFPFYFALNGLLSRPYSLGMAIGGTVLLVVFGFLGVGVTTFCQKRKWDQKPFLFHFLRILLVILVAAGSFGLFLLQGWVWAAASGVIYGGIFFWGTVSFYREYKYMISSAAFVVSIPCFALCIFFPHLAKVPYDVTFSVVIFIVLTALYGIIKNQINIDQHMEVRHHSKNQLPEKIRRYNTTLLIVPFALLLILFLLRKYIGMALGWLGRVLLRFFALFASALEYIKNLIFQETQGGGSPPVTSSPPDSGEAIVGTVKEFNPVLNVLLWIVMIGLVVFLLTIYRQYIADAFRKIFRFFRDIFDVIFQRFDFFGAGGAESEYYSDSEETLNSREIKAQRKPTNRQAIRQWKQHAKEFLQKDPSSAQYREGYRLVLDWIHIKDIPILDSDTPNEIFQKAEGTIADDAFFRTTDGYNRLRYGGLDCEITDFESLRRTIHTLQAKIK